MTKKKDDIFQKGTKKLNKVKNSKILTALILGFLLTSNSPIIAQDENTSTTTIEDYIPDLIIECESEHIEYANRLKSLLELWESLNINNNYLLNVLKENKTKFQISNSVSNYYLDNTINISTTTLSYTSDIFIIQSIAHEATHLTQEKDGIIDKIKTLPPKQATIANLLLEFDATLKSRLATKEYYSKDGGKEINNYLKRLPNIIPEAMGSYIAKSIHNNTNKDISLTNTSIEDIINMLNANPIYPHLNYDEVIDDTYNQIPDKYKKQIEEINTEYLTRQKTILNEKGSLEK